MGKGGQGINKVGKAVQDDNDSTTKDNATNKTNVPYEKALKGIHNNPNYKEWISPFTPERVDPRAGGKLAVFPTKSELRAVIPPHCFERSDIRSMSYVVKDVLQGVFIWYLTHHVLGMTTDPPVEVGVGYHRWIVWMAAWNIYAFIMANAVGGLWVIGHECGHGAFSAKPWLNGLVGWTVHSALLVPYFSWAFTHAKHHRRTNDLVEGETHVPSLYHELGLNKTGKDTYERKSAKEVVKQMFGKGGLTQFTENLFQVKAKLHEALGDTGFANFLWGYTLFFMWEQYMLGAESTGHRKLGKDGKPKADGHYANHFNPNGPLFPAKMFWKVVISDIGCGITLSLCGYFAYHYGFRAVWFWYAGPYMHVHAFLVAVTWLQHADPTVPHYAGDSWSWIKGSIAGTIDRPMYPFANFVSHNISTTHVMHHCFHTIPHYHAVEATKHVRAFLEPLGLYNFDDTDMAQAILKVGERCHFVDSTDDGVQYYQSLADVPLSSATASKKEKAV